MRAHWDPRGVVTVHLFSTAPVVPPTLAAPTDSDLTRRRTRRKRMGRKNPYSNLRGQDARVARGADRCLAGTWLESRSDIAVKPAVSFHELRHTQGSQGSIWLLPDDRRCRRVSRCRLAYIVALHVTIAQVGSSRPFPFVGGFRDGNAVGSECRTLVIFVDAGRVLAEDRALDGAIRGSERRALSERLRRRGSGTGSSC